MAESAVILLELSALVVLAVYLFFKAHQRARHRAGQFDPAQWTGKAIDVTGLRPAVEKARHEGYVSHRRTIGTCFHRALLGLMRRDVTRFAYFQHKEEAERLHG